VLSDQKKTHICQAEENITGVLLEGNDNEVCVIVETICVELCSTSETNASRDPV
jgi:hypothetical protein